MSRPPRITADGSAVCHTPESRQDKGMSWEERNPGGLGRISGDLGLSMALTTKTNGEVKNKARLDKRFVMARIARRGKASVKPGARTSFAYNVDLGAREEGIAKASQPAQPSPEKRPRAVGSEDNRQCPRPCMQARRQIFQIENSVLPTASMTRHPPVGSKPHR